VAFTGGNGADTFNALETQNNAGAVIPTWTVGDAIDGGLGTNDVFNVTQTAAIANPLGATVTGIETLNAISAATIALNTTAFTGLTALNTTSVGGTGAGVTAAATTAVTATNTGAGTVTLIGGSSQTVSTVLGVTLSGSTGAVNTTSSALAAGVVSVNGGSTVTVNATGQTTGTIGVGATTAATGAVSVTTAGVYVDGANNTIGLIGVTGGSEVNVTVNSGITAAQNTAALTDTSNNTATLSAVTVTGNASTTAVTVTQSAAVVAVNAVVGPPVVIGAIGVTNGGVVIADVNAADRKSVV
jgi:S-layer protein